MNTRWMAGNRFAGVIVVSTILGAGSPAAQASGPEFARPAAKDWPMVGGDWNNTRFSTLTQINTQNIQRLGAAWISKKFDEGGTSSVTPVVKDGLMFVSAGRKVYALNAKTGEPVWSYQTVSDPNFVTSAEWYNSPKGVPNRRGVAVGAGLVFVGLMDGHVIALRETTGERVWIRQTGIDEPKKGQWASAAPTYINGTVYTGLSDGERDLRGRLTAIDAETGRAMWRIFSIPSPGEPGHETWPSFNDTWKSGGGGVWTNPAVDPELATVYVTTGNPASPYAGDGRPGDNLYTSSVLAVDAKSGKLKWYYQLVHHDVFEGDAGTPVILYETHLPTGVRKGLAVLRADGYLFQLDAESGKPLLPVKERPVPQLKSQRTSPTQPFPVGGESFLMSCEEWKKEAIPAGFQLGCMWTPPASPPPSNDPQNILAPSPSVRVSPMAYSPQTGYFYAQGTSALSWPRRSHDPYFSGLSASVPGLKRYFELAAIDSRTGKIAWKKRMPTTLASGGPIVTAGGLMFRSSGDGNVEAYDAQTGDVLWQFQTGVSGSSGSPATYEVDDEQYVAVPMGPAVWAFKLGGTISSAAAPAIATLQEEFEGLVVDTDEIETTSLHHSLVEPGKRYFVDEFAFNPYRASVRVGAKVLLVNNGLMRHEIVARDGSWGTGPLHPTQQAWVSFEQPGEYSYICRDHPWSHGQIVVVAGTRSQSQGKGDVRGTQDIEQARRGQAQFNKACSVCHGEDLSGRNVAPALAGQAFRSRWDKSTVGDLFDRIWTTMPQSSPGSLDRQTYLDIVAYLLRANGVASGQSEVKDDTEALKNMKIGKRD